MLGFHGEPGGVVPRDGTVECVSHENHLPNAHATGMRPSCAIRRTVVLRQATNYFAVQRARASIDILGAVFLFLT